MSVDEYHSLSLQLGSVTYDFKSDLLLDAGGNAVLLRNQSQKVLRLLIENRGKVLSKDQIMDAVWQGVAVTDDSLTQCIADIRRVIKDRKKDIVKTVSKQGYILSAQEMDTRSNLQTGSLVEDSLTQNTSKSKLPQQTQRRTLTVLSCEVIEYSALSARLDPELLIHVQHACSDCFADVIERRLGWLARVGADDMVAYFGLTEATDFDAERAVEAALQLSDAIPQLACDLNAPLTVRIGISTGLVVITPSQAQGVAGGFSIAGRAPILATHLRSTANAGEIILSQDTRQLLRGLYTYEELREIEVPGQRDLVERVHVTGRDETKKRFHALRGPKRLLIGRDDEMGQLFSLWGRARVGDGSTVLISGEAGIGKSRLADELFCVPRAAHHNTLLLLGSPNRQDSALFPLAEGLGAALGFDECLSVAQRCDKIEEALVRSASEIGCGPLYSWQRGTDIKTPAKLVAEFLGIPVADRYEPILVSPDKLREMLLEALISVIEGLAVVRPLVILCEDMHWFDASSIELMDMLIDRLSIRSILLVITFRPEFEAPWVGQPQVTSISLTRLTKKHSAQLVEQVVQNGSLPEDLVNQICVRADGVPLFLEELSASIIDDNLITPVGDSYAVTEAEGEWQIPATLQETLLARLDRALPNRTIAQIAAALGRRFSYAVISAVLRHRVADLDAGLAQLVKAGLLFQRGQPPAAQYTFKHALVQELAYDSAVASDIVAMHAQIATELDKSFANIRNEEPELLALHYTKAHDPLKALPLWAAAGFLAASQTAHTEAVAHFTTGLNMIKELPADRQLNPLRLQLLMGLVRSLGAYKGYAVAEIAAAIGEARAIGKNLDITPETFLLFHGMCQFLLIAGDQDGALEMATKCIEISYITEDPVHRCEAEGLLGYILFSAGEMDRAMTHLTLAEEIYVANDGASFVLLNTHDTLNHTLVAKMHVLLAQGRYDEFDEVLARNAAHVHALQRPYDLAFNHAAQAFCCILRGKGAQALPHAEQALRLCQVNGFQLYEMVCTQLRAQALGQMGHAQEVVETACQAIPLFQSMGMRHFEGFYLGEASELLTRVGRMDEALTAIDKAIESTEMLKEGFFLSPLWRRKGSILLRVNPNERDTALAAFKTAEEVAIKQGAPGFAEEARAAAQALVG